MIFFMNLRTAKVLSKYFSYPPVLLEGRDFLTVDLSPIKIKFAVPKEMCKWLWWDLVMTLQDCVLNIGIEYLQHVLSSKKNLILSTYKGRVSSLFTLLSTSQLISYVIRNRFHHFSVILFWNFTLWKYLLL